MSIEEDIGRHRIQKVVELTDVGAPTLRSWERRYGVPIPKRSASAYRLYSDHDLDVIRAMKKLCDRGVPASEAARIAAKKAPTILPTPTITGENSVFDTSVHRLVAAVERFRPKALEREVRSAISLDSATVVFERVIAPAMHEVGELWEAGKISVAQEHLFSNIVETSLRDMLRMVQPAEAQRSVILGCFPKEQHTFGLYGIGFRLAGMGFRTINLGARTPPYAIADAVERLHPNLVALSLVVPVSKEETLAWLKSYRDAVGKTPWMVGGRGAALLRDDIVELGSIYYEAHGPTSFREHIEDALRTKK